jgi:hypothetical protein
VKSPPKLQLEANCANRRPALPPYIVSAKRIFGHAATRQRLVATTVRELMFGIVWLTGFKQYRVLPNAVDNVSALVNLFVTTRTNQLDGPCLKEYPMSAR